MPTLHHFQLPHRTARKRQTSRKRKRDEADEEDTSAIEDDAIGELVSTQSSEVTTLSAIQKLTGEEAEQYRTAGLSPGRDIPSEPFPHIYPETIRRRGRPSKQDNSTGNAGTAHGSAVVSATANTNLRQNHIAVLTTMMHRCLLEGDYERAGKAWGMLLRSGPEMDMRRADRWGIGGEVLMRKASYPLAVSNEQDDASSVSSADEVEDEPYFPRSSYTQEGFDAAKRYYERLIVQYPNLPHGDQVFARASTFYPAFFSVWLRQVADAKQRAIAALESECEVHVSGQRFTPEETSPFSGSQHSPKSQGNRLDATGIHAAELREAHAIAARLDALLQGPPYDHDTTFLELRGMVSVWLADLMSPEDVAGEIAEPGEDSQTSTNGTSTSPEGNEVNNRRQRHDARQSELLKAEDFFAKVSRGSRTETA